MKKITLVLMALALLSQGLYAQKNKKARKTEPVATENVIALDTYQDSISYIMGMNLGTNLKMGVPFEFNMEAFKVGLFAGYQQQEGLFSQEVMYAMLQAFGEKMQASQNPNLDQKNQEDMLAENKAKGQQFLAENAKREGVKVTASGLQYEILREGTGSVHPTASDVVKVHYTGTLIDGTVFDSSVQRGEPISFPLNQVIAGWTEGVQLMTEGAKFRFYIPSGLAYGDRNISVIPGGSTLIFEVELLGINK